jgi:predicted aldo/keto reductase-like oxidoreductase
MRFVQLPVNLAMAEAVLFANQLIEGRAHPLIEAARGFDVAVMASAPILQGRLARGLPAGVQEALSDLPTDALRAIQFARSVPGGMTALVGMSRKEHVAANLSLVGTPPLDAARFRALFDEL